MEEMAVKKSDFVHSRLSPLLRALDDDILAVSYGKVGTKEHVYIVFDGGYLAYLYYNEGDMQSYTDGTTQAAKVMK